MQVFAKRVIKNRPSVTRNSGKSLLPKQGFSMGLADAFSWCLLPLRRRCCELVSWGEQRVCSSEPLQLTDIFVAGLIVLQAGVAISFLPGTPD